jgi:hypothetical protein
MAKVEGFPTVTLTMRFTITESEARALDALAGYGDDEFIMAFYDKLGKAYMQKHEDGLRSFLKSVRDFLPHLLSRADAARNTFLPTVPAESQFELANRE